MIDKMSYSTVARNVGQHRGDPVFLMVNSTMIRRAAKAGRNVAAAKNMDVSALDDDFNNVVYTIEDHLVDALQHHAMTLVADYRSELELDEEDAIAMTFNTSENADTILLRPTLAKDPQQQNLIILKNISIYVHND